MFCLRTQVLKQCFVGRGSNSFDGVQKGSCIDVMMVPSPSMWWVCRVGSYGLTTIVSTTQSFNDQQALAANKPVQVCIEPENRLLLV